MSTPYQPMNGAWYRVLTLAGEVQERMQYRDGQFYGTAKRGDGSVRVIPLADVERVARRFAPKYQSDSEVFHVVNAPAPKARRKRAATPKIAALWNEWKDRAAVSRQCARERLRDGWTPEAAFLTPRITGAPDPTPFILDYIQRHGPACVNTITAALDRGSVNVIGRALRDAVRRRKLHVAMARSDVGGNVKLYHFGPAPRLWGNAVEDSPKWINPIRRRALGLPVAHAPHPEPDTDYAHPRKAA